MMNSFAKVTIGLIATIIIGSGLVFAGIAYAQSRPTTTFGPGMMGNNTTWNNNNNPSSQYGPGMMNSSGIMNGSGITHDFSMMNGSGVMNGSGMMNGDVMNGLMSMMGGFGATADPLTIAQAEEALNSYLVDQNNPNLLLGEIMIFDNHAYAQILDKESGEGAYEVLVNPVTLQVLPEPGPNMMWNSEYGIMNGANSMMGGGMMGNYGYTTDAEISVSPTNAVELAQQYLDSNLPGTTAGHADTFPGYYTLHVEQDGTITGMLSVNAYSGQVFLHHWHGNFIEMSGE